MTPLYELTRLTVRPASIAVPALQKALASDPIPGRLLGAWMSEIGTLNQVVLLHAVDDPGASRAARAARSEKGDLFGHNEVALAHSVETFAGFPGLAAPPAGRLGPVYELREYTLVPDGLAGTLAAWQAALPARLAISPLVIAAYALEGVQPRIFHIWPYPDLNERARIRADAGARGIWPPKGGAARFATMQSSILLPLPFSPLQ